MFWTYLIIAVLLLAAELVYFKIADACNIIDKPNERSSHSAVVLRGGGVIFTLSMIVWAVVMVLQGKGIAEYLPFLCGLVLIAGVSFVDDVHSLPDNLRMGVQIGATLLMFWSAGLFSATDGWLLTGVIVALALFFCVGATNFINFMDGINGITAAYGLAMLMPLLLVNGMPDRVGHGGISGQVGQDVMGGGAFIEPSYLVVAMVGLLVFALFNFRPKGKAKCFAGDVGEHWPGVYPSVCTGTADGGDE